MDNKPEQALTNQPVKLVSTIADLKNVINEIKTHVMDAPPSTEKTDSRPMSDHKLLNIKEDLLILKMDLEDILRAVSSL